jgi:hypothetical protein
LIPVTDEEVRSIALFFLFTFLDEKTAVAAAESATAQVKALPRARSSTKWLGEFS